MEENLSERQWVQSPNWLISWKLNLRDTFGDWVQSPRIIFIIILQAEMMGGGRVDYIHSVLEGKKSRRQKNSKKASVYSDWEWLEGSEGR